MLKPRTGKILKCKYCSKECYIPKNRVNTFRYCSRSCGAKYVRISYKKNCDICNTEFEHISSRANKAKYCSRKCYHKAQSKKGRTIYECKHCHKKFNASLSTKRKYCSKKCVNKESKKIFKPVYSTVRKAMISRGLIKDCNRCGYSEEPIILGVHHKDRNRNNNAIDNLEVLCPNCHSLEHMKHINHGFKS